MLKLGQSQVKRDELVTRMETLALPLVSLGWGEADRPRNSHCEHGGKGSHGGTVSKCFTHRNSLNPHNNPARKAPPSSPSYRCRN